MNKQLTCEARIVDEAVSVPMTTHRGVFFVSAFTVECDKQTVQCASLHVGDLSDNDSIGIPVRIHSGCVTGEVFGDLRCDCAWQFQHGLDVISAESRGVLLYLPSDEGRGIGLVEKIKSFRLMNEGLTTAQAFVALRMPLDGRTYMPAMAVLKRFGITRLRLITNNPLKINAVREYGFEVVDRIPTVIQSCDKSVLDYLESKRVELGHLIEARI